LRRRSRRSGLFLGKLDIPLSLIDSWRSKQGLGPDDPVPFQAHVVGEPQTAQGQLYLARHQGLSIISDIDDTIKLTRVCSRRDMLAHTFMLPFTSVDGMSEVYRYWASFNTMFHYVSSSPWQIYEHLHEFLGAENFPAGSMHLRWFRLRDEMFKRWRVMRRKSKGGMISDMIKRMPGRRFILVGDSGERDPEIYAKVAHRFRERISAVVIRDLVENPIEPERLRKIQKRTGPIPLILFRNSSEIRDLVAEMS
jgi:phosphatidate phosphatase APP1